MRTAAATLTALTRLAARRPAQRLALELALRGRLEELAHIALDIAVETGDPIGSVLAELIEREGSVGLVESILSHFDEPRYRDSVALFDTVLISTRKALAHLQEIAATHGEDRVAEIARLTSNMSFSLSRLGRQEEAREAAHGAVEAFRDLSSGNPGHIFELAVSLGNFGVIESNLGNYEDAVHATEEAVQICRRLTEEWSIEMAPVLAQSLINLGSIYFSLGLGELALPATQEAVGILQHLEVVDPGNFRANLARGLNNLGAILRSIGRFDEALEVTSRGLNIRRSVAEVHPSTSLLADPVAIDTLMDLSDSFLDVGERETALRLLIESFDILKPADVQRHAEVAGRLRSLLDRLTVALEKSDLTVDSTRIAALEHAVRSVTLFFRKQPLIFADPMNTAILMYLTTLLRAGKEADRELIRPIIQAVEKEILGGSSAPL